MDKNTKFYKVTALIVKHYDTYKNMKPSEVARLHNIPSGVASHIMRTIYIMKGGK